MEDMGVRAADGRINHFDNGIRRILDRRNGLVLQDNLAIAFVDHCFHRHGCGYRDNI